MAYHVSRTLPKRQHSSRVRRIFSSLLSATSLRVSAFSCRMIWKTSDPYTGPYKRRVENIPGRKDQYQTLCALIDAAPVLVAKDNESSYYHVPSVEISEFAPESFLRKPSSLSFPWLIRGQPSRSSNVPSDPVSLSSA
eukprot:gb/GECG01004913.1/.p1 GENE.gb/GECG01004913.1/~~gb/GECG01004913.1/.p1  ORF type:complete len:138 (+),score=7.89 gb/GECG01004913.1/:1-414(+)